MSKLTQLSALVLLIGCTATLDAVLDDQDLLKVGVPQKKITVRLQCPSVDEQNTKEKEAWPGLFYETSLDEALESLDEALESLDEALERKEYQERDLNRDEALKSLDEALERKEYRERKLNKITAQMEEYRKKEKLLKAIAAADEFLAEKKALAEIENQKASALKAANDQKEKEAKEASTPAPQQPVIPAVAQPKPSAAIAVKPKPAPTTTQTPKPAPTPSQQNPQIVIPIGRDVTDLVDRLEKNVPNELRKGAAKIEKGLKKFGRWK